MLTGISAIDGLATLVRGQKLPIFSVGGLPHLELAAQIAAQAHAPATSRSPSSSRRSASRTPTPPTSARRWRRAAAGGDLVVLLNTAEDPVVERLVTPQIALTVAEHLAFEHGRHVLVVMADLTSYCEALREVVRGARRDPLAPRLSRPPLQRPGGAAASAPAGSRGGPARSPSCRC